MDIWKSGFKGVTNVENELNPFALNFMGKVQEYPYVSSVSKL